MIDKQEEISFLKRLKKYFKNVQQKDIMQNNPTIESDENCGCFGAHIAKLYNYKEFYHGYSTDYFYDYEKGKDIFHNNTSRDTLDLFIKYGTIKVNLPEDCLLYTSPSPRDRQKSRMPSSA